MINQAIEKYIELIKHENQQGGVRFDQRALLITKLNEFLTKHVTTLHDVVGKQTIQELSNLLIEWYNNDGEWEHRSIYIQTINHLSKIGENPEATTLEDRIREYTENAPYESYLKIGENSLKDLVNKYTNEFISLGVRDLRVLNLGLQYLSQEQLPTLIAELLNKIASLPVDQKEPYLDIVGELRAGNDPNLTERFYQELISIKPSNPELAKKYNSKHKFLSKLQKNNLKK